MPTPLDMPQTRTPLTFVPPRPTPSLQVRAERRAAAEQLRDDLLRRLSELAFPGEPWKLFLFRNFDRLKGTKYAVHNPDAKFSALPLDATLQEIGRRETTLAGIERWIERLEIDARR